MSQPFRLPHGGLIDRSRTLHFRFDGRAMTGHPGDTLASALLAGGRRLVARSLKYHRPRGILSAGLEEPSALVTVDAGTGRVPNLKVTEVMLADGMQVFSQNAWPSLAWDAGGLLRLGGGLLSAGFYYKTFIWPRGGWPRLYERLVRRVAGHGAAVRTADPALYDARQVCCDLLVIGGGAAGLSAALAAARGGAAVAVVEASADLGGALLWDGGTVGGVPARDWAAEAVAVLTALPNAVLLPRTLAFGHYDHGLVMAVQTMPQGSCAAVSLKIRARRIVLASGAIERPLIFAGNDLPGVMLAASVRQYITRHAVAPGRRAVIAVSDPQERAATAAALEGAGIAVAASLGESDSLLRATGRRHLGAVRLRRGSGREERIACDLLCVSAGWTPAAQLAAQSGGALRYDSRAGALLPEPADGPLRVAGAARGALGLDACLADGRALALRALGELGLSGAQAPPLAPVTPQPPGIRTGADGGPAFVDLQNDVTCADIAQAAREGYGDVELAKRYTTLGMGTDQGKTGWTDGILALAGATGQDPSAIAPPAPRPPWSPVSIGALVGARTGAAMSPTRRTPFHAAFEAAGCVLQTAGDWLYPRYFPEPGETMAASVAREVRAVRGRLGCTDMSTLGKIEVQGPDALTFLSRLLCTGIGALAVGRLRYVLMLREDGIVLDDGTVARLAADRYLLTTTTARAGTVWRHMQRLHQLDWPGLDVTLTRVSDHWASLAIAGPQARRLLAALDPDFDCATAAFPFASVREGRLGGNLPARVCSVSFSGELSYEVNVPAGFAGALWERAMDRGTAWGIAPYGLEALDVLRIEKGHVAVGTEIDGRRVPDDLGLGALVSARKDFVGRALLARPALAAVGRAQLVGLRPADGRSAIPGGSCLASAPWREGQVARPEGQVTASIHSPTLGHPLALGFLRDGRARLGQRVWAVSPLAGACVAVLVTAPCAYDPDGERLRG